MRNPPYPRLNPATFTSRRGLCPDHPDNGQFFLAELADFAGRVSHHELQRIG
jgi:hypothetical protein